MQFYKATGVIEDENWTKKNEDRSFNHQKRLCFCRQTRLFNRNAGNKAFVTLSDASEIIAEAVIFQLKPFPLEAFLQDYLDSLELKMRDLEIREISLKEAVRMLEQANRYDYIDDNDEILREYDLEGMGGYRFNLEFVESVLEEGNREQIIGDARKACSDRTLLPELKRIFLGSKAVCAGHPVHYLVRTDDGEIRKAICRPLLQALYANRRIRSLRYSFINVRPGDRLSGKALAQLYKCNEGGTVILRYEVNDDRESDRASADRDTIEILCDCIKEYRSRVLTILCLPRVSQKVWMVFCILTA